MYGSAYHHFNTVENVLPHPCRPLLRPRAVYSGIGIGGVPLGVCIDQPRAVHGETVLKRLWYIIPLLQKKKIMVDPVCSIY